MKITESNSFVNLDAYARQVEGYKKRNIDNNAITKGQLKDDEVTFSAVAQKLSDIRKTLDSLPDIRQEKTAHLKSQIEDKSYGLDEKMIASGMLRESLLNEIL